MVDHGQDLWGYCADADGHLDPGHLPAHVDLGGFTNRLWIEIPESYDMIVSNVVSQMEDRRGLGELPAVPDIANLVADFWMLFEGSLVDPASSESLARRCLSLVNDVLEADPECRTRIAVSLHVWILRHISEGGEYNEIARALDPQAVVTIDRAVETFREQARRSTDRPTNADGD